MSEKAIWVRADDGELYPLPVIKETVPEHLVTQMQKSSIEEDIARNVLIVDLQKKLIAAEEKVQKYETVQEDGSADVKINKACVTESEKEVKPDLLDDESITSPSDKPGEEHFNFVLDKSAALAYSTAKPNERATLWLSRNIVKIIFSCVCAILLVISPKTLSTTSTNSVEVVSQSEMSESVATENIEVQNAVNFDDYSPTVNNTETDSSTKMILAELGPLFISIFRIVLMLMLIIVTFSFVTDILQWVLYRGV